MSDLIPEDLMLKMMENHRETCKGINEEHYPVVKLHYVQELPPVKFVWLISEVDPSDKDTAFCLADLGMGFPELGYSSISDIESLRHPRTGDILVELDDKFEAKYTLGIYAEAARMCWEITEDEKVLRRFANETQKQTYDPT
jgi:hypothetical protein